ncbi:MAG: ABC-type transport auxiliary lipoprotein family protein [Candidatus Paracaedibacteraceae bacterium]|nr:ABC-type transport auxiliary lipoprotein family protein [Candidatus Paracaedibacteraceae bacterium]
MMQRLYRTLFIVSLLLTGCGPLIPTPGEAPKRYTLSHLEENNRAPVMLKQVVVEVPTAAVSLDSVRVAVVPAPQQINYYADMEWSDRLPILIQESLVYSLQNQHLFRAVTRSSDGVIPDQSLKIDIRKFYIDQTGIPTAHAEYFVRLIDVATRNELVSKTFTGTVPLKGSVNSDLIAATLDQANREIIEDLQRWVAHAR